MKLILIDRTTKRSSETQSRPPSNTVSHNTSSQHAFIICNGCVKKEGSFFSGHPEYYIYCILGGEKKDERSKI